MTTRTNQERFSPSTNHWRIVGYKERVTRKQLQDVLLESPDPIIQGEVWTWAHRHIGVGIYELWAKRREEKEI